MEAEKKIHVLKLLSSFRKTDDNTLRVDKEHPQMNISLLLETFAQTDDPQLDADAMAVIFYIAGYIGRSVSRMHKCEYCKCLLIQDQEITEDSSEIQLMDETSKNRLFQLADKGGLAAPTEFCILLCIYIYYYLDLLQNNSTCWNYFLSLPNHSKAFCAFIIERIPSVLYYKHVKTQSLILHIMT